jgi:hypothetical protein
VNKKIVIAGGTACGPKAAARARRCDQQAQRILDGAGFKDVKFMDGSIASWPYQLSEETTLRE